MKTGFLKTFFLLVAVVLAASGWFWHQGRTTAGAAPPPHRFGGPLSVETALVATQDIAVTLGAVGTLSSGESAEIRAEIAGAIKVINFSEGRPVKKGESLVEIDDSLIRAELLKAEANYNMRKMTFARSDKLKTSGFVSSQDWEQSGASLQEALADIESARIRLEKTKVPAPFDGLAGLRSFSVGDYVQVGQILTTLDAVNPVKIVFSIPEKNYADIRIAQEISFSVDSWPGESFSGDVYAISPRISQDTRNFDVKASVPNVDGRLRPGMFALINIVTAVHKGALLVPEQALVPKGNDSYVFVVRGGKAVFQKVGTGLRQSGSVEITGGLAANEPVVVAGVMRLHDGASVKVLTP